MLFEPLFNGLDKKKTSIFRPVWAQLQTVEAKLFFFYIHLFGNASPNYETRCDASCTVHTKRP